MEQKVQFGNIASCPEKLNQLVRKAGWEELEVVLASTNTLITAKENWAATDMRKEFRNDLIALLLVVSVFDALSASIARSMAAANTVNGGVPLSP
jgi:hypothetical protein